MQNITAKRNKAGYHHEEPKLSLTLRLACLINPNYSGFLGFKA